MVLIRNTKRSVPTAESKVKKKLTKQKNISLGRGEVTTLSEMKRIISTLTVIRLSFDFSSATINCQN